MVLVQPWPSCKTGTPHVNNWGNCQEPGRQKERRLQIGPIGLFFADFMPNIQIFVGEIFKNLAIAGANYR